MPATDSPSTASATMDIAAETALALELLNSARKALSEDDPSAFGQPPLSRLNATPAVWAEFFGAKTFGSTGRNFMGQAAADGRARFIRFLLDWLADEPEALCALAQARDSRGRDSLMGAAAAGHAECVKLLLPSSNLAHADSAGQTALMQAVAAGHEATAACLVEAGASLDTAIGARTLFMLAAEGSLGEEQTQKMLAWIEAARAERGLLPGLGVVDASSRSALLFAMAADNAAAVRWIADRDTGLATLARPIPGLAPLAVGAAHCSLNAIGALFELHPPCAKDRAAHAEALGSALACGHLAAARLLEERTGLFRGASGLNERTALGHAISRAALDNGRQASGRRLPGALAWALDGLSQAQGEPTARDVANFALRVALPAAVGLARSERDRALEAFEEIAPWLVESSLRRLADDFCPQDFESRMPRCFAALEAGQIRQSVQLGSGVATAAFSADSQTPSKGPQRI